MSTRRPPTWPVIPLALPAAVSIWAGWVGLGQLTGFGVVQLLPGIWDGLRINTAVTLPVGMEAYAAFALYVWLHRGTPRRARDFARVSSIVALTLGALGQVAYHLMAAAGVTSAPWPITAAVACLPVGVLGMGATLAHLLSTKPDDEPAVRDGDAATSHQAGSQQTGAPLRAPLTPATSPSARPATPIEPTVPIPPDPVPPVRPAFRPAVRPGDGRGGQSPDRTADRSTGSTRTGPAERSASLPADRSTTPTRNGPARKRTGKPKTDAELSRAVRELAESNGGLPSQYAVKQALGVGSGRAARLLAELGDLTPAGEPGHNGTARREGTR